MSSPTLPSHLSESMFRRYEPLIAEGLKNFPKATKFTPGPEIGLTTFTARFRDAITSFRRYSWSTTLIDVDKFANVVGSFVIRSDADGGCVWFCQRQAAGRAPAGVTVDPTSVPTSNVRPTGILSQVTPEEIAAFCLLLNNQRIVGPILILGEVAQWIDLTKYDVGISYDPQSDLTTLI